MLSDVSLIEEIEKNQLQIPTIELVQKMTATNSTLESRTKNLARTFVRLDWRNLDSIGNGAFEKRNCD